MRTRRGIYYWRTRREAEEWAEVNGWPTDRIIPYQRGWAVQAGVSGNYAGPWTSPQPWFTPEPKER